jgi:hypothetical protein
MSVVQAASDAPHQKPNIIVILADDYGWGSLGCYGAPAQLKTPHLDRLAREGRRFTNAYAPSSVCSPTRYGLMTGRYDWRTRGDGGGVIGKEAPLQIETDRLTLASLCKGQGYRTAAFGKWHLGLQAPPGRTDWNKPLEPGPRAIGFDYFFGISAGSSCFILKCSLPSLTSTFLSQKYPGCLPSHVGFFGHHFPSSSCSPSNSSLKGTNSDHVPLFC